MQTAFACSRTSYKWIHVVCIPCVSLLWLGTTFLRLRHVAVYTHSLVFFPPISKHLLSTFWVHGTKSGAGVQRWCVPCLKKSSVLQGRGEIAIYTHTRTHHIPTPPTHTHTRAHTQCNIECDPGCNRYKHSTIRFRWWVEWGKGTNIF